MYTDKATLSVSCPPLRHIFMQAGSLFQLQVFLRLAAFQTIIYLVIATATLLTQKVMKSS